MKIPTLLLAGTLVSTGAISAVALARGRATAAASFTDEGPRHPGPDSARVELFLGGLRAADPILCQMVADQLGNFWSSYGAHQVGLLADDSRSWESARDSLEHAERLSTEEDGDHDSVGHVENAGDQPAHEDRLQRSCSHA